MSTKEYLTDDEKQWAAVGLGVQAGAMHKTQPRDGDMTGRTRFRVEPTGWGPWAKPLVVLQAEYLTTRGGPDNYDPHWHEDLVPVWRDVRPEHLPKFEARVRTEKPGEGTRVNSEASFYKGQLSQAEARIVDLLKELDAANAKIAELHTLASAGPLRRIQTLTATNDRLAERIADLERELSAWRDATHPSAADGGFVLGRVRRNWFASSTVPVNPPEGAPAGRYLIGQRVILNGVEIGTVCAAKNNALPNTDTEVWVHSPSRGFANRYAVRSIQPLPGGQL